MDIFSANPRYSRGQSLVEILVGIGLGAIFFGGSVLIIANTVFSLAANRKIQTATDLASELLDNAKIFAESDWHNIYGLNKGSADHYYLSTSTSPTVSYAGNETITIDGTAYTRHFYVDNASRDSNGDIVSTGGTQDPSTQKVTVTVTWPNSPNGVTFSELLTRYNNYVFIQTDWSGGAGQEFFPASSSVNNAYASGTTLEASGFGVGGSTTIDPTSGSEIMQDFTADSNYIYAGGAHPSGNGCPPSFTCWYIMKLDKSDGALDLGFGINGSTTIWGTNWGVVEKITNDTNYIYAAGYIGCSMNWCIHIKKLDKSTGNPAVAFGTNGSTTISYVYGLNRTHTIEVDSNYIYTAGYHPSGNGCTKGGRCWQIIKLDKTNGLPVDAFGTHGSSSIDLTSSDDEAGAIAIDTNYLYIAGSAPITGCTNTCWHIEKRDITTNAPIDAFGIHGSTTINLTSGNDGLSTIEVDSNYMYLSGTKADGSGWHIKKLDKTTGNPVAAFGMNGSTSIPAGYGGGPSRLEIGSGILFTNGFTNTGCYIGGLCSLLVKLDLTTGLPFDSFGNHGSTTVDVSTGTDFWRGLAFDSSYVYEGGTRRGCPLGGDCWYVEKRDIVTGELAALGSGGAGSIIGPAGELTLSGSSGSIESSIYDTGIEQGATFNSISWEGSLGDGTVKFQVASSNASSGPWNYLGLDGSGASYYAPSGPNVPAALNAADHSNKRYVRYKLFMDTSGVSPTVTDVIINWSP